MKSFVSTSINGLTSFCVRRTGQCVVPRELSCLVTSPFQHKTSLFEHTSRLTVKFSTCFEW